MKSLYVLAVLAAGALLGSKEAEDAWTTDRLLNTLTKGVPTADLAPRTAKVETEAARAVDALMSDPGAGSSCRALCGEAVTALETLCTGLIQPAAARSKAVCYARTAELAGSCSAHCPP